MEIKRLSDENIKVEFSTLKALQFWLPAVITFYGVFYVSTKTSFLLIHLMFVYFFVCLGHCVGLHRHFIHETFKTNRIISSIFLLLTALSGIGGPLTWIKIHALRDHWQNQSCAPKILGYRHNIFSDFFYNLHLKITPLNDRHLQRLPNNLLNDSRVLFYESYWILINLLFCFCIYFVFGFGGVVWIMAFRYCTTIAGHWLVGYIVHRWGEKRYEIENASEEGRNQLLLGWLTFGEAYHNNHHKFPSSASMGLKKIEFDLAFMSILALEKMGLAKDVKISKDHFLNEKTQT